MPRVDSRIDSLYQVCLTKMRSSICESFIRVVYIPVAPNSTNFLGSHHEDTRFYIEEGSVDCIGSKQRSVCHIERIISSSPFKIVSNFIVPSAIARCIRIYNCGSILCCCPIANTKCKSTDEYQLHSAGKLFSLSAQSGLMLPFIYACYSCIVHTLYR